jgi:hypothetical protein
MGQEDFWSRLDLTFVPFLPSASQKEFGIADSFSVAVRLE